MKAIVRLSICLMLLTISFGAPSALAVNKALSLDGDGDYVYVSEFSWSDGGEVTVEFWTKVNTADVGNRSAFGVGKSDNPNRFQAHVPWSDKVIYWDYGSTFGTGRILADYSNYLDKWTHVALVSEGNGGTFQGIYLDGVLVASSSTSDGPDVPLSGLWIGQWMEGRQHKGIIDEFRIWNIARTQEEIRADMNQPIENPELLPNVVGYWNFDDGTADDLSQYGNDGTLQGDATIVESELPKVIFVPDDYPTIQNGIDAANLGDIVVVDPGTYNENIILKSGIALQGSGADVTTIDGGGSGSVIKMSGISDVTISGFTITNGLGNGQDYLSNDNGGGIAVYECSNITIQNNIITQNYATGGNADGGGILIAKSTAPIIIAGNTITDNHPENWGGGISIQGTLDVQIAGNEISNNDAAVGDGISLWVGDPSAGASALIINNGIANNQGDGIYIGDGCSALIGGNRDNANDIFGNTEYAVRNDSTNDINATYNYWGTTVGIEIQSVIYDYYDDPSKGVVNYKPWMDETHRKVFPFAQALNLDGDGDYVEVPFIPLNDRSFTIEMWVQSNLSSSQEIVFSQTQEESMNKSLVLRINNDGSIRMGFWANDLDTTAGVISIGHWYHLAFRFDYSTELYSRKIYVNGEEKAFDTPEFAYQGASGDTILGAWYNSQFFYGIIDEVRIWNIARTQEEIQADMNQPLENPQSMPNLVGYWNFDDSTANDSSPYSNHGTLMGDAEIIPLVGTWPPPLRGDLSGDGTVSAYDAALILQYVVGLIDEFPADSMGSPSAIEQRSYELSLPNVETPAGKKIQVPIAINDAKGLLAGGMTIKYDQTVLRAVDYASLKLLNGYYWKANTNLPGEVRFAFATTEVVTTMGQGNLLMVEFEVLPNTEGRTSPLILENVNLSNSRSITKINGEVRVIPSSFVLLQNFPNPFNPDTWLPYKLASDSPVSISIYNAKGQLIRTLHLGYQNAGVYVTKEKSAYWDGKDNAGEKVASGVYFYTLRVEHPEDGSGKFVSTRKMVIMK